MPDDVFLDTNTLIYLYSTESAKQQKIQTLLNSGQNVVISTQVIGEFCNVLLHKLGYATSDVKAAVKDFRANFDVIDISTEIIEDAFRVHERYHYRFLTV